VFQMSLTEQTRTDFTTSSSNVIFTSTPDQPFLNQTMTKSILQ